MRKKTKMYKKNMNFLQQSSCYKKTSELKFKSRPILYSIYKNMSRKIQRSSYSNAIEMSSRAHEYTRK